MNPFANTISAKTSARVPMRMSRAQRAWRHMIVDGWTARRCHQELYGFGSYAEPDVRFDIRRFAMRNGLPVPIAAGPMRRRRLV